MTGVSDSGSPPRWTPLASGSKYVVIATVLGVARLFVHIPMPDIAPAAVHQHVASLRPSASGSQDGVRIELPQQWSLFARNVRSPHSPQNRVTIPGLGQVPVDVKRTVVFAARRDAGKCAVLFERARVEQSLDEDVAAIERTVTQNVYERNVFNWVSGGPSWFARLVDTADDILNEPGPAKRLIDFKPAGEASASIGRLPARQIGFSANVDGRESDGLMYVFAHQYQWQYAFIALVGEPPRQCAAELGWIQSHLSFE